MDFWNREKVMELRRTICDLQDDNVRLKEMLDKAEKKLRGERVCDGYCKTCIHSIEQEQYAYGGVYTTYTCELDCKCKEFQKKDAESK